MSAKPAPGAALLSLLQAQTFLVEAQEGLVKGLAHVTELDDIDARLGDAMRAIASARSAVQDRRRAKLGLVTIAETG